MVIHPHKVFDNWDWDVNPLRFMLTYAYPEYYEKVFKKWYPEDIVRPKSIMMDSGAWTAKTQGKELDLREYIDYCKYVLKTCPVPVEIVGLDVIGAPSEVTYENCRIMQEEGIECIPTFHYGENFSWLDVYAKNWRKIGLGRVMAKPKEAERFFHDSFVYLYREGLWPTRVHSFGLAGRPILQQFPFQSADCNSYLINGVKYGIWMGSYGRMSVRGENRQKAQKVDIKGACRLEREVASRWRSTFQQLPEEDWEDLEEHDIH